MTRLNSSVAVAMSGGVDSSVALFLLKEQGFNPVGVSFKYSFWQNKKNQIRENVCCTKESFDIAKIICQKLNVPYYILDCSKDFKEIVMGYFLTGLREKRTPNPCLICNREIKFKKLFEFAKERGIRYVATGHHVRVKMDKITGKYKLLKGKDKKKDQSYFLCLLTQKELKDLIFPIGDYQKEEVYQIAKRQGFDFFLKKKESQDLCFVSGKSLPFYFEEEIGLAPGEIRDTNNKILGKHQGLHFYTIGQRKGLEIKNGPWWVADFERKNNFLIVSNNSNDPAFYKKIIDITEVNFISGEHLQCLQKPFKVKAKTRYQQKLVSATLLSPDKNSETFKLIFDTPQKAITPGQWAVFYQRETCLGGGVIK